MTSITSDLCREAGPELQATALVMRPDWGDGEPLRGAMVAARTAGWSWVRTFKFVSEMLTDDKAQPYQLRDACRDSGARSEPADTGSEVVADAIATAKAAADAASKRWQSERDRRSPGEDGER